MNTPDVWKLAYSVSPTLQGKGIATAAVKTVLGYAAKAMGVRKVEAVSGTLTLDSSQTMAVT